MNLLPITFQFELTAERSYVAKADPSAAGEDVGRWIVEGFASTGDLDSQRHIITEQAIQNGAKSLQEYRTLLFNHNPDKPIGYLEAAAPSENRIWIKAVISRTEPYIWDKVKDGTLSKFSVKGRVLDGETTKDESGQDVLTIKDMELFEVSLVSVPANPKAHTLAWYIEKAMKLQGEKPQNGDENIELASHLRAPRAPAAPRKPEADSKGGSCVGDRIKANLARGMKRTAAFAEATTYCRAMGKDASDEEAVELADKPIDVNVDSAKEKKDRRELQMTKRKECVVNRATALIEQQNMTKDAAITQAVIDCNETDKLKADVDGDDVELEVIEITDEEVEMAINEAEAQEQDEDVAELEELIAANPWLVDILDDLESEDGKEDEENTIHLSDFIRENAPEDTSDELIKNATDAITRASHATGAAAERLFRSLGDMGAALRSHASKKVVMYEGMKGYWWPIKVNGSSMKVFIPAIPAVQDGKADSRALKVQERHHDQAEGINPGQRSMKVVSRPADTVGSSTGGRGAQSAGGRPQSQEAAEKINPGQRSMKVVSRPADRVGSHTASIDDGDALEKLIASNPWLADVLDQLTDGEIEVGLDIDNEIEETDGGEDTDMEKNVGSTISQAYKLLEGAAATMTGTNKDQLLAVIRSLKAMAGGLAKENEEGTDTEDVEKAEDGKAEDGKSETVELKYDTSQLEAIVAQLQETAKKVTEQVEMSKSISDNVEKAKGEIDTLTKTVVDAVEKMPIRKGQGPAPEEERKEKTTEELVKESVGGAARYDKMNPGDKLHAIFSTKLNGNAQ